MHGLETLLPPWLRAARRASFPTRVEFPHGGIVLTIFPREQQYVGRVTGAAAGLLAGSAPRLTALAAQHPHGGQPLEHLDWWLALHQLQTRARDPELPARPVHLQRWPSLTDVPEDLLPAVARACALLTRDAIPAEQVADALGLPPSRALALLEILRLRGLLHIGEVTAQAAVSAGVQARVAAMRRAQHCSERAVAGDRGLIGRLWERLGHVR